MILYRTLALSWMLLCALLATGCSTLRGEGTAASAPLAASGVRQASFEEDAGEETGFGWSDLQLENLGKTTRKITGRGPNRTVARELYQKADAQYRQAAATEGAQRNGLFTGAAPMFEEAAERWPDSALAMDALFMAGESMFFADDYTKANHYYELLIKRFPNNRYMDVVDQRRFAIARFWLETNRENPEPFYYVNFLDQTRPWKDARGNGLRVFDKIRIDDPTGRLADDATLALANEHFADGRYYKADEYYTDLRKAYTSSEHLFLAYFLGLKTKLSAYNGPAYSGAALDEAEKLIKQMRRQFPQESEQEREFLDKAMAEVRFRKAERLEFLANYYDNRGEYRAATHYYTRLVQEFPDTPLAQKVEPRIGQIADLPPVPAQKAQWLVNLFPESDPVKPLLEKTRLDNPGSIQSVENIAQQPAADVTVTTNR